MTINAAWQCHMEDIVGSLLKGKFADFVILESDPMKVPEKEILNIKIWQTWKGGEKWYQGWYDVLAPLLLFNSDI